MKGRDSGFEQEELPARENVQQEDIVEEDEFLDAESNVLNMADPNAIVAQLQQLKPPTNPLPRYSGKKKGQQYQTETGMVTEMLTAEAWTKKVDRAQKQCSWSETVTAAQAEACLPDDTPAALWYEYTSNKEDLSTWTAFKSALLKNYGQPMSVAELVKLQKECKQGKNERVMDFIVRTRMAHDKLWDAYTPSSKISTADDTLKKDRERVWEDRKEHGVICYVIGGLQEDVLAKVTEAEANTVEEILKVAKKMEEVAEQSKASQKKQVASVEVEGSVVAELKEVKAELAALKRGSKGAGQGAAQTDGGPRKPRQKPWCYYCLVEGHISPKCPKKEEAEAEGKYRATVRDAFVTKEEYERLPRADKLKGKKFVEEIKKKAAEKTTSAIAVEGAVGGEPSFEERFADYYSKN